MYDRNTILNNLSDSIYNKPFDDLSLAEEREHILYLALNYMIDKLNEVE